MSTAPHPAFGPRWLISLVILLPMIVQAVIVRCFGVNMLVWDEFVYGKMFREIGTGQPWRYWIWHQHNEHRIVWTKLVMLAHASVSGWNPVVDMYVSAVLAGVISFGLWKLYRSAGGTEPLLFLPVALLLCSLANSMNMLYGLMSCHYFTIAGMVWAVVFLLRRTIFSALVAAGFAFAAMISTLNAIVIWPVGLIVLFLTRQRWPRWLVWIVAMIASLAAYFVRYQVPGQHKMLGSTRVTEIAISAVTCLGSPLSAASVAWARALGVVTLLAIALSWLLIARRREFERYAGPIAITIISLGCIAAIALGRSGPSVMESKYVLYSTLAIVGTYISLAGLPRRDAFLAFTLLICVGWLAANLYGLKASGYWRKERLIAKYQLSTIDIQPDETIGGIFFAPELRHIAAYLRAAKLGPFRDPVDALMSPRWRDGAPTDGIVPGAEVRAEVLCPVDTLRDFGFAFSPSPGAPPAGTIHVSVKENGAELAHAAVDAATIHDFTWIAVKPASAIRGCRGKQLSIEIWSPDAAPGSGLHAWTYPVYYAGVTKQGSSTLDQRSLGIAFNGFAAELVP